MSLLHKDAPAGLRDLKKARTRARIQDHALRLYTKQGYAETTIDQIAEAADVSQSTFFRYFPTKAETVLYDRWDPVWIDMFIKQPAHLPPLTAARAALRELRETADPEELRLEQTRMRLVAGVPELLAASAAGSGPALGMFLEAVGIRVGRDVDDFAVHAWLGALAGVVCAAFLAASRDPDADIFDHVDAAIAQLEEGLPL